MSYFIYSPYCACHLSCFIWFELLLPIFACHLSCSIWFRLLLTILCMSTHTWQSQSSHSMHLATAGGGASLPGSQPWHRGRVGTDFRFLKSPSVDNRKLSWKAAAPRFGMTHSMWHRGHRNGWPGPMSLFFRLVWRQDSQKLWQQGSSFGWLYGFRHTGHLISPAAGSSSGFFFFRFTTPFDGTASPFGGTSGGTSPLPLTSLPLLDAIVAVSCGDHWRTSGSV